MSRSAAGLPRHPYGVQPEGNALLDRGPHCSRAAGLGALAALPDDLLLALLGSLPGAQLAALSTASRACFAFACCEELWRAAALERWGGDLRFRTSWRATYRRRLRGRAASRAAEDAEPQEAEALPDCSSIYSDLLYAPHLCAATPLQPRWLAGNDVPRVARLSHADFVARFEQPNTPVILTDVVPAWPAAQAWRAAQLEAAHGDEPVYAGGFRFALSDYLAYAARVTRDDAPLYLFDREVLGRTSLGAQFEPPAVRYICWQRLRPRSLWLQVCGGARDHFALLPAEHRPDHTWLIAGPQRSGSSWHKDPNSTSAWNGVVCGCAPCRPSGDPFVTPLPQR